MKNAFKSVFDKEFIQLFYYSNSFTYDRFYDEDKVIFQRIIFSNEYVNKEYKYRSFFGHYTVERMVAPKWNYIKQISRNEISLEKFIDFFSLQLDSKYYIKTFDPARHGDWPGFHFHRIQCGSKTIIASPEKEVPNDTYGFSHETSFEEEYEVTKDYFYHEWRIDFDKLRQLKSSTVFIFLYDNASIIDWKVFQNPENTKREGIDVRLNIAPHLHPFPNLELECELLDAEGAKLFAERISLKSRYDIVHKFLANSDGEIHRCIAKLYEDGKLIDDHSGIPIRKIQFTMHPMGSKE